LMVALSVKVAPHSSQNFAPGWLSAPQAAHLFPNVVPQALQKFAPSRLSLPHFEQRIYHPFRFQ
jgi:hypothetical protein